MGTLLFTTVQNKSGKDIIAPGCFRYNLSSNVMAPAATVSELRVLFGGDQVPLGMTVIKISMATFSYISYLLQTPILETIGSFGSGLFFIGFS